MSPPPHIGGSGPIQEKNRRLCHFGVFPCHFGRTPESYIQILFRHLRGVLLGEVCTRTKPIAWVVEVQEEEQFCDGIDGPSKFTDPAVPPAHTPWNLVIQVVFWKGEVWGHLLSIFGTDFSTGRRGINIQAIFRKLRIEISIKLHYHCPK